MVSVPPVDDGLNTCSGSSGRISPLEWKRPLVTRLKLVSDCTDDLKFDLLATAYPRSGYGGWPALNRRDVGHSGRHWSDLDVAVLRVQSLSLSAWIFRIHLIVLSSWPIRIHHRHAWTLLNGFNDGDCQSCIPFSVCFYRRLSFQCGHSLTISKVPSNFALSFRYSLPSSSSSSSFSFFSSSFCAASDSCQLRFNHFSPAS